MFDIHCHIIPGVDDGAASEDEAFRLLKMEYRSGVRTLILTPHYRKGMFEPSEESVRKGFDYVKSKIEQLGIDMEVYLGCEYHANSNMVEDLTREPRFRMNGGRYVLVEFASRHNFSKIRNWIYEVVNAGFKPVIAHVERYPDVVKDMGYIDELIDLGALMQVDAGAILGEHGLRMKHISRKLLKNEQIHFIGSDAHDAKHSYPNLDKCKQYVTKKAGEEYAVELFVKNPQVLLK